MPLISQDRWREAEDIAGDCFYDHTVARAQALAPLTGEHVADVVVIGAGVAGLSCALELAARGIACVVLEAKRVGSGASGRNGGQLLPGFSCDLDVIRAQLGDAPAREAWDMSLEGMSMVREHAARASDGCDYQPGWMILAARRGHVEELASWYRELSGPLAYGNVEFVHAADVGRVCGGTGYHAALVDHHAGHLNPLKLMLALACECDRRSVRIFENSKVTSVARGARLSVATAQGSVRCKHVVVAANVFAEELRLVPERQVMTVGNTIIATEPIDAALCARMLPSGYSACDTNFMLDYFRITAERRMLWGGGSTYLKHDSRDRVMMLRKKMIARFPELGAARIDYAWGGLIDVTASRAPDFGRIDSNVFYLQGFSGHGLNVAAIAGRITAEAILGDGRRFGVFCGLRHRAFPRGALLRRAVLSVGTWYFRARDALA